MLSTCFSLHGSGPRFSDLERDMLQRKSSHAKAALAHTEDVTDAFRAEITSKFPLGEGLTLAQFGLQGGSDHLPKPLQ